MKEPSIQTWAFIYVVLGCVMVLVTHHFGLPTDLGSSIIGAGIGAFTVFAKQQQNTNVDHADKVTVQAVSAVSAPDAPKQGS